MPRAQTDLTGQMHCLDLAADQGLVRAEDAATPTVGLDEDRLGSGRVGGGNVVGYRARLGRARRALGSRVVDIRLDL